ncbi:Lsr2 dimerization domain-containing protein [Streptomyces sp. 1222.5]|uniref:Lsr2 dimerization domain-containing protein n=1 Tax=Streptomyces sp. 1222.5 TaxID=1881026 RepID=UPI003D75C585
MTGHHNACLVATISGLGCDCTCHTSGDNVTNLSHAASTEMLLFGLDGVSYEVDLTNEEASTLRAALTPFVSAARLQEKTAQSECS